MRIPDVSRSEYRVLMRMVAADQSEGLLSPNMKPIWGGYDDPVLYAKNPDSNPGPCPRCGAWNSLHYNRPRNSLRAVLRCHYCGERSPLTSVDDWPEAPPPSFEVVTRREMKRRRSESAT